MTIVRFTHDDSSLFCETNLQIVTGFSSLRDRCPRYRTVFWAGDHCVVFACQGHVASVTCRCWIFTDQVCVGQANVSYARSSNIIHFFSSLNILEIFEVFKLSVLHNIFLVYLRNPIFLSSFGYFVFNNRYVSDNFIDLIFEADREMLRRRLLSLFFIFGYPDLRGDPRSHECCRFINFRRKFFNVLD